jgi:hypothetical protein
LIAARVSSSDHAAKSLHATPLICYVIDLVFDAHCYLHIMCIAGAGMGFLFGMFLGAMGDMQPISMINGREVPQPPLREQVHDLEIRM